MEPTGLSLGKSVLDGALGYANSAIAEEVALQLGVQKDQAFIRDELEMMLAFLMAAHEERDEHKVIKTWVKQVRDVAYDVEDCLQDLAVRLGKPSWWCFLRTLIDRHRVATRMKELRAKVEDVSQRNVRYRLIKSTGPKPAVVGAGPSNISSATMFGISSCYCCSAKRAQEAESPTHTCVVNIAQGKPILHDIKRLTRLHKLSVTGINKKNCQEFCSALEHLSHLESLSVDTWEEAGLRGCLDDLPSPPERLQSLKLLDNVGKLPEWIASLQNLVKLKLDQANGRGWHCTSPWQATKPGHPSSTASVFPGGRAPLLHFPSGGIPEFDGAGAAIEKWNHIGGV